MRLTVAGEPLEVQPQRLIIAGFTGRDEAAVRAHIDELAAIGVPVPDEVPTSYPLDPALLTTGSLIGVSGANTSGEVEPVLIRHDGTLYLGVGSDHTDRDLERADIAASKAACGKPVGPVVVPFTDLDWDALELASHVDGIAYQHGKASALRHPVDLLDRFTPPTGDIVLFCGTLPLLTGEFLPGQSWQLALTTPDGTTLRHAYRVDQEAPDAHG
jgi:4-hydroxyphenylacetate 3-monooxygenase